VYYTYKALYWRIVYLNESGIYSMCSVKSMLEMIVKRLYYITLFIFLCFNIVMLTNTKWRS